MISFDLTEEQRMIRDTIASFAVDELRPAARAADRGEAVSSALLAKSWELGLVRSALPEEFGGYGDARSALTGAIVAEELAYGDLAIALHMLAPRLLVYPVAEMGTDDQRRMILGDFAGDEFVAASAALMEPRFDFDPAAMATVATRDGSSFILKGTKCLVPLAVDSQRILVYAAIDRESGLDGVAGFIVARDAAGLAISSEPERNMGINGLKTYEVTLQDCRISETARLGADGTNFKRILGESRVAMAAMAVGVSRAAFEYARDYAKERKAFGVPIATKQAIAFMLAEMAIEIDATRLLTWEAGWHLDRGEDGLVEASQARDYSAQVALMVADNALQILGGHGYTREHPVEMWLRNARGFAALEGLAIV